MKATADQAVTRLVTGCAGAHLHVSELECARALGTGGEDGAQRDPPPLDARWTASGGWERSLEVSARMSRSASRRRAAARTMSGIRTALWSRVREPVARALRIVGTLKAEVVADLAAQGKTICGLCGLYWQRNFLGPATESLPEPRAWRAA